MIHFHDKQYLDLVKYVIDNGVDKQDRTGTGTRSVFGYDMRFDLSDGSIPLLTTKKMSVNAIIHELLWYIAGDTNIKYLVDNNVHIWNEWPFVAWLEAERIETPENGSDKWKSLMDQFKFLIREKEGFADDFGDLGPVYGAQWRRWPHVADAKVDYSTDKTSASVTYDYIDQLGNVINTIKTNPNDRRMIVNSWNVGEIANMKLPPCHYTFQFYVANGKLSCKLTQRSCDVGLGVPFNIVQYSILVHMIAQVTGLEPGEFIWSGGDTHVYLNHVDPLINQLQRDPFESPTIRLNTERKTLEEFTFDDFEIIGYKHHDPIRMMVAV